ncbi:MAG: hypothetical protein AB1512_12715 [Thermodesulfobacteriota bacterium]
MAYEGVPPGIQAISVSSRFHRRFTGEEIDLIRHIDGFQKQGFGRMCLDFLGRNADNFDNGLKEEEKVGEHEFDVLAPCTPESLDLLSETDIESIQTVLEKYGHLSTHELILHTRQYPEWTQYEKLFKAKQTKREKIFASELLSSLPDGPFSMPTEHVEESRRILTGLSD